MTSQSTEPVVLQSRLIAFLDILGFSARLESSATLDLHREYSALIDEAQETVFGPKTPEGTNFAKAQFLFDSVVLVSHPVDGEHGPTHVFHFMAALCQLMENAFSRRLPLRGAVAFGDFLDDLQRQVFLSPVFPSLVRAEKEQDWCGAIVLPNAVDAAFQGLHGVGPEQVPATPTNFLIEYDVPTKDDAGLPSTKRHWCVNWVWFSNRPVLDDSLLWITERKRIGVRGFIDHVNSLATGGVHVSALPPAMAPAVAVRIQAARGGVRMKFTDVEGRGVDPPAGQPINVQVVVIGGQAKDPASIADEG